MLVCRMSVLVLKMGCVSYFKLFKMSESNLNVFLPKKKKKRIKEEGDKDKVTFSSSPVQLTRLFLLYFSGFHMYVCKIYSCFH